MRSLLAYLSKVPRAFRESRAGAKAAARLPLPDPTYESVFEFIRRSSFGWVKDISAIKPADNLVGRDRFDSGDISYFAAELDARFGLDIRRSEWESVATFDDMTRLFLKHLLQQQPDQRDSSARKPDDG